MAFCPLWVPSLRDITGTASPLDSPKLTERPGADILWGAAMWIRHHSWQPSPFSFRDGGPTRQEQLLSSDTTAP